MIDCGRRQAHADMEIDLLLLGNLYSCSKMQQVPRPTIFREVTRALDKIQPFPTSNRFCFRDALSGLSSMS
jgi:hypothetical protein